MRSIVEAARGVVLLGTFDPGTSERAFRVGGSDFTMLLIVPALVRLLRAQAPRSTLDLVPVGPQILASLESGPAPCFGTASSVWSVGSIRSLTRRGRAR